MDRVLWSVRSLLLLTVAVQLLAVTVAAPDANLIPSLPGQPKVAFKQYGGYITVDQSHGRKLFYYFVEAAKSPATAPLVLWLNGGPGCSSLGGAFSELGPFYPNSTGDGLIVNNFAWNQVRNVGRHQTSTLTSLGQPVRHDVALSTQLTITTHYIWESSPAANVIFLESPAGVGFSYSNDTSDYNTGDDKTAQDSLAFLLGWLSEYPEYNSSDFYITGESYAGHYIPQLAAAILKNNNLPGQAQIRLQGIMAGNPLFDVTIDLEYAPWEYAWGHGMVDEDTHDTIVKECNYTSFDRNQACLEAETTASIETSSAYLDPYDVLEDMCLTSGQQAVRLKALHEGKGLTVDPCIDGEMNTYLNLVSVENALHSEVSGWSHCSNIISYNDGDEATQMAPVLADLVNSNLRVWVYSGDADIVIPVVGTRKIINTLSKTLNLNPTSSYQPWFQDSQIGGWTVSWGLLVFSTVRGAGHLVPGTQPARSLQLLTSFPAGDPTPPLAPAN